MPLIRDPIEQQAYSIEVAAHIIGAPRSTVERWCIQGILASTKIGRRRFIRRADLERLLAEGAPSR